MDASSIITQVSRDDEQLSNFSPEKVPLPRVENELAPPGQVGKKPRRGFLRSLFCCFSRQTNSKSSKQPSGSVGRGSPPLSPGSPRFLLPSVRHQDMHKKCMVIDLDETLVHSSFKYADPVADLLDRWGVFRSRLFRESCVFHRGNYVKDLNKLGRDLQKVIIVDNSPASYIFHPDNAVPVASWFDDMTDSELLDLIPFFEKLSKVDNVYTLLCNSNHPYNIGTTSSMMNQSPPPQQQHNNLQVNNHATLNAGS